MQPRGISFKDYLSKMQIEALKAELREVTGCKLRNISKSVPLSQGLLSPQFPFGLHPMFSQILSFPRIYR